MGYYSEVAMKFQTVNGIDASFILDIMRERLKVEQEPDEAEYFLNNDRIQINQDNILLLYWGSVKWYEHTAGYGCTTIMKVFEEIKEAVDAMDDNEPCPGNPFEGKVVGAQYIRIGEDRDDYDETYHGDLDDYMYITRTIDLGD